MPDCTGLTVHNKSRVLEISFDDNRTFNIPLELLRVYSPSAEVRGHGAGQEVLQVGKSDVTLLDLQPVGNYAVKPSFSDGHDSGLYTWEYLYDLGANVDERWTDYMARLHAAGFEGDSGRVPGTVLPGAAAKPHACGHNH